MTREIEFRGKIAYGRHNGKWFYGYYFVNASGDHRIFNYFNGENEQIDPATFGEYTGLKDKNGTKIFEGDVVGTKWGNAEIMFDDGSYCFIGKNVDNILTKNNIIDRNIKVIGNIYENSELIKNDNTGDENDNLKKLLSLVEIAKQKGKGKT